LTGLRAAREIITTNPDQSVRMAKHDYPSPVARWNYHPEIEIHLIRKGAGRFIVGDFVGTFRAGHVALVGSGLPHDWVSDLAKGEVLVGRDVVIQIDPAWLEACSALMPELHELSPLLAESARGIEFAGRTAIVAAELMETMADATGIDRLRALFQLLDLLVVSPASDRRVLATEFFQPQLDERAAAVVDIVLEYVFAGHTSTISMAEAAQKVGMSSTNFSKYFKNATGQNFSELLRKLRVAHAGRLLHETKKPVSDICYEVGFTNLSNFNRQFLRETGSTPRQYRHLRDNPAKHQMAQTSIS
jgi:AraC-like DNA-binding protein